MTKPAPKTVLCRIGWTQPDESHSFDRDVTSLRLSIGNIHIDVGPTAVKIAEYSSSEGYHGPTTMINIPLNR